MDKCNKCSKPATVSLGHLPKLCDTCFLFIIEKRIRREIRQKYSLKPNEKIAIVDNNSKESKITEYILKNLAKDMPLTIEVIPTYKENFDKVFIPWNATDEANAFLEEIFEGKKASKKGLPLLKSCSEEELQNIAKILKIPPTKKDLKYSSLVDSFESQHPGTIFSIVKSVEKIREIQQ